MRNTRSFLLWLLAGAAGLLLMMWAYPRAFPFLPQLWSVSRDEAVAIALERFRDLGDPVKSPYIVALLEKDYAMERRLQLAIDRRGAKSVEDSGLPRRVLYWQVLVFPRGAQLNEWTYLGYVSLSGELLGMRWRLDPQAKAAPISQQEARNRADAFLASLGTDLSRFQEPEFRSEQLAGRTDLTVRYRDRRNPLEAGSAHGIHVRFAGDRLAGFGPWLDDPHENALNRSLQGVSFLGISRIISIFLFAARPRSFSWWPMPASS